METSILCIYLLYNKFKLKSRRKLVKIRFNKSKWSNLPTIPDYHRWSSLPPPTPPCLLSLVFYLGEHHNTTEQCRQVVNAGFAQKQVERGN